MFLKLFVCLLCLRLLLAAKGNQERMKMEIGTNFTIYSLKNFIWSNLFTDDENGSDYGPAQDEMRMLGNIHQTPMADEVDVEFLLDDMVLSREQMDDLFDTSRRNAVIDNNQLWPDKTVPVLINDEFSKNQ